MQARGDSVVRVERGFTLVEVLIALAVTAVVATLAYSSLGAVINSVEGTRVSANRITELDRAWNIISRDLRHFVPRPVRDEFGELEPAMQGGPAARFLLSFTRSGWHNPNNQPRSELQRINYVLEDESLWRESYVVLDRAPNTEPRRVQLASGVQRMDMAFLNSLQELQVNRDGVTIDTRNWAESWVRLPGGEGSTVSPPAALEITLELEELGEVTRIYELPSS